MNFNAKVILSVRNFFRKHGRLVLIILTIWLIMFIANIYLKLRPKEINLSTSYNPDVPIMDNGDTISKNKINNVNDIIKQYFEFCNSKNYNEAFDMLTQECKDYLYDNDVNLFQEYVDSIFTSPKIYNIQNYSNVDNVYIYNLRILDDITATGTSQDYQVYQDKLVIHDEKNEYKLSNQGYIGKKQINKETEEDNMKVKVIKKEMSYYREEYTLEIRNKTDSYIMLSDDLGGDQITLNLGTQRRAALNTTNANIIIIPGESRQFTLLFDKYYDDGVEPEEINFNNVRLLSNISSDTSSEEGEKLITKNYSMNINLK